MVDLGYNYRLTEIEAALGCVQLGKLDASNKQRGTLAALYRQTLSGVPGLALPFGEEYAKARPAGTTSSHHLMSVVLPDNADRDAVAAALRAQGIQTSVHYRPLHTFSSRHLSDASSGGVPRLASFERRLLTLPLYPRMTEDQVGLVADQLRVSLRRAQRS